MYYIYILKSHNKNWHYVGMTENVQKRLAEHNSGITPSTKPFAPFDVIYTESYKDKEECRKREIRIKKNHALKKALIPSLK